MMSEAKKDMVSITKEDLERLVFLASLSDDEYTDELDGESTKIADKYGVGSSEAMSKMRKNLLPDFIK